MILRVFTIYIKFIFRYHIKSFPLVNNYYCLPGTISIIRKFNNNSEGLTHPGQNMAYMQQLDYNNIVELMLNYNGKQTSSAVNSDRCNHDSIYFFF